MSTSGRFFVYILASRKYGTLYAGVTGNLPARIFVHREALIPGFSSRYKTYRLVYFEQHDDPLEAIERQNPDWDDLYENLFG